MSEDTNIVLTADVNGYTQGMQQAAVETNKTNKAIETLATTIGNLKRSAQQKIAIVDAATTATIVATQVAAAKLEDQMSQLEARSVMTGNKMAHTTRAISDLRREYGMAAESAIQLATAMNSMGARTPQQTKQFAENYVRLSAVTGESVTGLASEQNQFIRTMNNGRVAGNKLENYSAMTAGVSANAGVSATGTLQFANQIAPVARNANMSSQEIMGWSAAFNRAGQDGGGASTAMNRILQDLTNARLYGGSQNRAYAGFLGMNSDQFNSLSTNDALQMIMEKTAANQNEGAKFWNTIGLDGIRTQKAIQGVSQSGSIAEQVRSASEAYGPGGVEKYKTAADKALNGLNEEGRKTAQTFADLAEAIGSVMLPVITKSAETFNTLLTPLEALANVLKAMPDGAKLAIGAGATAVAGARAAMFIAPKVSTLAGVSAVRGAGYTGAAALGFRSARNPGMKETSDLAMLRAGEGGAVDNILFGAGQVFGGLTKKGRENNPTKAADASKSDAARAAEERAERKRAIKEESAERVKAETEARSKVSKVGLAAAAATVQAAATTPTETNINFSKIQDTLKEASEASLDSGKKTLKLSEEIAKAEKPTLKQRAIGVLNMGASFANEQLLDLTAHAADAGKGEVLGKARSRRAFAGKSILDSGRAIAANASDGTGSATDKISSAFMRFTGGEDRAREAAARIDALRGDRYKFRTDLSLGDVAKTQGLQAAKTYGSATLGGMKMIGSGLMGLMGGPIGLAGMGVTAGIAGINYLSKKNEEVQEEKKRYSEIGEIDSLTKVYANALGEASEAVLNFAEEIRGATKEGDGPKNALEATTVTEEDILKYGTGSRDKSKVTNQLLVDQKYDENMVRDYIESVVSTAGSPNQIQAAKADLLTLYGEGNAADISKFFKDAYRNTQSGGNSGAPWDMFRYGNTDLGLQATKTFGDTYQRIAELNGQEAANQYALQGATGIYRGTKDDKKAMESSTRSYLESLGIDTQSDEVQEFISLRVHGMAGSGAAPRVQTHRNVTEDEFIKELDRLIREMKRDENGNLGPSPFAGDKDAYNPGMSQGRVFTNRDTLATILGNQGLGNSPLGGLLANRYNPLAERIGTAASLPDDAVGTYKTGKEMANFLIGSTNSGTSARWNAAQFVAATADQDPNASALGAEALGQLDKWQARQRLDAGQTTMISTAKNAYEDYGMAQRLFNESPTESTLEYMKTNKAALEESYNGVSNFIQGVWKQTRDLERNYKYQQEDMAWNNAYSRERFDVSVGRSKKSYERSMGWQEEDWDTSRARQMESYNRSRKYQEEDFNRSRKLANEDYHRSRLRNEEQYQISRKRQEMDYQRFLIRGDRDWNISRKRQLADYNRSRLREEADYNHSLERMAKQTAQSIMDIYSRISVERTWSAQGLLENYADQQRQLQEQLANLDKARKLGLSNDAIEQMGLADAGKAQQLQRLVDDLNSSTASAADFNKAVEKRIGASTSLTRDKSNSNWTESEYQRDLALKRQEEDFKRSLRQTEEDRKRSLKDSLEDYNRSVDRQEEDRRVALAQQAEDFARSMALNLEQFKIGNQRSAEELEISRRQAATDHKKSLERSNLQFKESLGFQREDFEESLRRSEEALARSHDRAKQQIADSLEDVTVSTDKAFEDLYKKLGDRSKDHLDLIKETYDKIKIIVGDVGAEVGKTWRELNISMTGNPRDIDPKIHNSIGGPESNSNVGMAAMLGAGVTGNGHGSSDPASGKISQGYHKTHPGVDIAGSTGDPIYASRGGVVMFTGNAGDYGNFTKISHGNGVESWYGHQSIHNVSAGDRVEAGQLIGKMGSTGRSTGPHLHYELRSNGLPLNPDGTFNADYSGGEGGMGGPNIDEVLKKADWTGKNKAFTNFENIIDNTPFRQGIKRGYTGKWWEDYTRKKYQEQQDLLAFTSSLASGNVDPGSLYKIVQGAPKEIVNVDGKKVDGATWAILQAIQKASGTRFHITKGSFREWTKLSGSTHSGAGVLDLAEYSDPHVQLLRKYGVAAWSRGPAEGFRNHTHAVFPVPGLHKDAFWQYKDLWLNGGAGLRGHKNRNTMVAMMDPSVAALAGPGGLKVSNQENPEGQTAQQTPSGSGTLGSTVRPVPYGHSGWKGGYYRSGGYHGGLDFPAPKGTPIRSMWGGTVIKTARLNRSYGHHAQVMHSNGLSTLYAHMSYLMASTGQKVSAGAVLGKVGSTGNSTGNHLHLEVRRGSTRLNPEPYLPKIGHAGGVGVATGGVKEVGEHGIELILGRSLRRFSGGETVLNNNQTRHAFNQGLHGYTPPTTSSGPSSIHYDHSMKVEQVNVYANDLSEMRREIENKQRLTALTAR